MGEISLVCILYDVSLRRKCLVEDYLQVGNALSSSQFVNCGREFACVRNFSCVMTIFNGKVLIEDYDFI